MSGSGKHADGMHRFTGVTDFVPISLPNWQRRYDPPAQEGSPDALFPLLTQIAAAFIFFAAVYALTKTQVFQMREGEGGFFGLLAHWQGSATGWGVVLRCLTFALVLKDVPVTLFKAGGIRNHAGGVTLLLGLQAAGK
eukprot:gene27968-34252_t